MYYYLKIERSPIIILVGGTGSNKTKFYTHFTRGYYTYPTTRVKCGVTIKSPSSVIIDTPGRIEFRNKLEYSWDCIFKDADVIVNFGDWSVNEVYGIMPEELPYVVNASSDFEMTMKEIADKLQECFPSFRSS
jgi:hypothetical protein